MLTNKPLQLEILQGGIHEDQRGKIVFINELDMSPIRRMYHIHPYKNTVRAWQAHKQEKKWFHCIRGSFIVKIVQIDDWDKPSKNLKEQEYLLSDKKSEVLYIPGGYANGFMAITEDAVLLVMSDFDLKQSVEDDIRFDLNYWNTEWI